MARRTAALGLAAALVLAGCASGSLAGDDEPSATPAPSSQTETSGSEPAASEEPQGIDTSAWLEYSTRDGDMTYRYPADWTLESSSELVAPDEGRDDVQDPSERWMDASTLTAPTGQPLLHSADFVDIGGWCDAANQGTVLHEEPIDLGWVMPDTTPVIAAIAFDGDPMIFAMGITAAESIGDDGQLACPFYFVFESSDGGASMGTHFQVSNDDPLWNIDSLDDAFAYTETDEYATLLEILRTVQTS